MSQTVKKRGFTIIEVVLVLAIAGLIFMMVFLAFPALQRSQKDTQRRDQLSGLVTQIIQFQSNNRNQLPEGTNGTVTQQDADNATGSSGLKSSKGWAGFYHKYLNAGGDIFEDPNGEPYKLLIQQCAKSGCTDAQQASTKEFADQDYNVRVTLNSVCEGENIVYNSGSKRLSVSYRLEGGGTFCANN